MFLLIEHTVWCADAMVQPKLQPCQIIVLFVISRWWLAGGTQASCWAWRERWIEFGGGRDWSRIWIGEWWGLLKSYFLCQTTSSSFITSVTKFLHLFSWPTSTRSVVYRGLLIDKYRGHIITNAWYIPVSLRIALCPNFHVPSILLMTMNKNTDVCFWCRCSRRGFTIGWFSCKNHSGDWPSHCRCRGSGKALPVSQMLSIQPVRGNRAPTGATQSHGSDLL